jgi:hypothetical protein
VSDNYGISFTEVYRVEPGGANEHVPTLDYAEVNIPLSAYAGKTCMITVISAGVGSAMYYMHIDNMKIGTGSTNDLAAVSVTGNKMPSVNAASVDTVKAKYQSQLTDEKRFMSKENCAAKSKRLKRQIRELELSVIEIEQATERLTDGYETLKRQHELLLSINGAGKKAAAKMIAETNAFRNFKNGRQFCCHAGVAPFRYDSGSSIMSKNRVFSRSDKSIKTLLHLSALFAATRKKSGELHEYYCRKVGEGKNKMSVLNAVRAILVLGMFAVIKFK